MKPRKRFGQHWLKSDSILNKILQAGNLTEKDRVLEIGPGTGILTQKLIDYAGAVLSVEIDRDLCKKLVRKFENIDNFLLLQGDFLDLNISSILQDFPKFQNPNKVIANIPYNITGLILENLLGTIADPNPHPYESLVLLIQKEVGDRLVAQPHSRDFGALSIKVQYLADCELICPVPAKSFSPPPKVDSVVVRLSPRPIATPATHPKYFQMLLKVGFSSKRKMLKNNLKSLIDPDRLEQFLTEIGASSQARGEELSLEQWIKLSNHFSGL